MKNHFDDASQPHDITDRERQAWKAGKNIKRKKSREELSKKQKERFLRLVAELSSPIHFERELGLSQGDIDHYKKEFGVESQDDARRALRSLSSETEETTQARIRDNIQQQRAAEATAQQRLDQFEQKKATESATKRAANRSMIDADAIRQADADRQKRFDKSQELSAANKAGVSDWQLELDGRKSFDEERIAAFKHDIIERGCNFCVQKYGASTRELKAEAVRLGLKIDWSTVRR